MVVLGADPDKVVDWGDDTPEPPTFYQFARGPVPEAVRRFCGHPRTTLHHLFNDRDKKALGASIRRLLESGYTFEQVVAAINRFYRTSTAVTNPHPALAFTNKEFQAKLLEGLEVEYESPCMRFVAAGLVRDEDMDDLPWPEAFDSQIRSVVLTEFTQSIAKFPEVVAGILEARPSPDFVELMDILEHQIAWRERMEDSPPDNLSTLTEEISNLPKRLLQRVPRG